MTEPPSEHHDQREDADGSTAESVPDVAALDVAALDVAALDVNGMGTVTVGLIAWAVAFVALLPFYSTLRANGDLWWLWTCVAGFGLGVFGREFCRRRAARIAAAQRAAEEPRPRGGSTR